MSLPADSVTRAELDEHFNGPWYKNPDNLALLLRWLIERGECSRWKPDGFAYFLERPEKWQAEWDEMRAEGWPT